MRRVLTYMACLVLIIGLPGCAALDRMVSVTDPVTGETSMERVGDLAADTLESAGGMASGILEGVAGAATGNPIVGAGVGAVLLSLVASGASKLRKKPSEQ